MKPKDKIGIIKITNTTIGIQDCWRGIIVKSYGEEVEMIRTNNIFAYGFTPSEEKNIEKTLPTKILIRPNLLAIIFCY